MNFYLRVEGVNLGAFVNDTNDLATIRGGSLLLLEAMDFVEETIKQIIPSTDPHNIETTHKQIVANMNQLKKDKTLDNKAKNSQIAALKEQKKALKKNKKSNTNCLATITKGASWGLFRFDTNLQTAIDIKDKIEASFATHDAYKYATFVIDVYAEENNEAYQSSRDKIQTLNHWQQLNAPSLSITKQGKDVCFIDKVRPADDKEYLPAEKNEYVSASVSARRNYGRDQKNQATFYKNRANFESVDLLELTSDLQQLSSIEVNLDYKNLHGKMAFIYLDGNQFGKKQKASKTIKEQADFDKQTRTGREKVLKNILEQIYDKESWLTDGKLRLETLLWGGDEIIWVVPAWKGWWMLNQFYRQAKDNIRINQQPENSSSYEELFHGSSLVFCKHNAPIHRIDALARNLADGFAKTRPFKQKNMIAYQVLESFDHAGSELTSDRQERLQGLSENLDDLLINADDMQTIENSISQLKQHDFPKRKIYQIIQQYRCNQPESAQELYTKLIGEVDNKTTEQEVYQKHLGKLKDIFGGNNAYWLHLMELWDYIGLDEPAEQEKGQ